MLDEELLDEELLDEELLELEERPLEVDDELELLELVDDDDVFLLLSCAPPQLEINSTILNAVTRVRIYMTPLQVIKK